MKILFQGDSITNAYRKPEVPNPAFQQGNGYVFLIAARLARDYPTRGFSFINRGIGGDCITSLSKRWYEDAVTLTPDLLSLLIGVNDTLRTFAGQNNKDFSDEEFAIAYRQLLVLIREKNPKIRIVLLEPYLLKVGQVTAEWKAHLAPRQRIVREIAGEFGAIFIPLQRLFDEAGRSAPPEYWALDGIHATHAGFQLIADAWRDAVYPLLHAD